MVSAPHLTPEHRLSFTVAFFLGQSLHPARMHANLVCLNTTDRSGAQVMGEGFMTVLDETSYCVPLKASPIVADSTLLLHDAMLNFDSTYQCAQSLHHWMWEG